MSNSESFFEDALRFFQSHREFPGRGQEMERFRQIWELDFDSHAQRVQNASRLPSCVAEESPSTLERRTPRGVRRACAL